MSNIWHALMQLICYSMLSDHIILSPCYAVNTDDGVHVDRIVAHVSKQGYHADDIKISINNLTNEARISSTFDFDHFQYEVEEMD